MPRSLVKSGEPMDRAICCALCSAVFRRFSSLVSSFRSWSSRNGRLGRNETTWLMCSYLHDRLYRRALTAAPRESLEGAVVAASAPRGEAGAATEAI